MKEMEGDSSIEIRSPFTLNKKWDKPLKLTSESSGSSSEISSTGGDVSPREPQPAGGPGSPKSPLIGPSPFSLSVKKVGSFALSPGSSLLNSTPSNVQKIIELQQEIAALKKEIDTKDTKLSSSLKSIKQFWSPELKKERAARKEETEKCCMLREQYSIASTQIQEYKTTLTDLEDELTSQQKQIKDLNAQLDTGQNSHGEEVLRLSEQIAARANEVETMRKTQTELQQEVERLTGDLQRQQDESNAVQQHKVNNLQQQNNKYVEEVQALTRLLDELESKYNSLLVDQEEKDKCIRDLEVILTDKEKKEGQHETTTAELEVLCKALRSQENEYIKLKDHYNRLHNENQLLSQETDGLKKEICSQQSLNEKVVSLETLLKDSKDECRESKREVETLRAREEDLLEKIGELEELFLQKDKDFEAIQLEETDRLKKEICSQQNLNEKVASLETLLKDSKDECRESKREVETLRAKEEDLLEKIGELEELFLQKDKDFEAIQLELQSLKEQLEESEKKSASASLLNELQTLKAHLKAKEQQINNNADLSDQLKRTNDENEKFEKEIKDLSIELQTHKETKIEKEKEAEETNKKYDKLNKYLAERESALENSREEVKELKASNSSMNLANQSLQAELFEQKTQLGRLERQKEAQISKTVSLVVYEDMKKECDEYSSKAAKQKAQLDDLKKKLENAIAEKNTADEQIEKMKKDVEGSGELKRWCENLEKEKTKLQTDLETSKTKLTNLEKQRLRSVSEEKSKETQSAKRMWDENVKKTTKIEELEKQLKEKTKQLSLLKKTQNAEKEKQHQLMNEKTKNETAVANQIKELKEEIEKKESRIGVLEDALRESVSVAAEREDLLAGHEEVSEAAGKRIGEMESEFNRVVVEKAITNIKNAFLILLMGERDALIASMKATRRRNSEELLNIKVERLLSLISEKDTQIAHLEISTSKTKRQDVKQLKMEKEKLVSQLKEQNNFKILHSNNDSNNDEMIMHELTDAPSEQVYEAIRHLSNGTGRLEFYIEELMTFLKEKNVELLKDMDCVPRKAAKTFKKSDKLSKEELMKELMSVNEGSVSLKNYVEDLLKKLEG